MSSSLKLTTGVPRAASSSIQTALDDHGKMIFGLDAGNVFFSELRLTDIPVRSSGGLVLDLKGGETLHLETLAGGGFRATPYDPDFEKTMEIAEEVIDEYRDTLATLAK